MIRPERSPSRRTGPAPYVAVTGAGGGLGRALLDRLVTSPEAAADRLVVEGVTADVRDPVLGELLAGVHTVVHLATSYDVRQPSAERSALNVRGTRGLLGAALAAGVQRVVLTTSAEVWGVVPGAALPLLDAEPVRGAPDLEALVGDHVEVEAMAAACPVPTTVLRPATLVGGRLGPAYDGQRLRQLGGPRLLALRGTEPLWQLCHVEDLLSALELAVLRDLPGPLAVAADGALPQTRVEALAGRRRLELPPAVALSTAERLHRLGVTTSSARELEALVAPVVVAGDGLRAAGWEPAWSNEAALAAHLGERGRAGGTDSRSTTATATSATVALLGTAALVRRTRRRRRTR